MSYGRDGYVREALGVAQTPPGSATVMHPGFVSKGTCRCILKKRS
jgi:hypothetical protein